MACSGPTPSEVSSRPSLSDAAEVSTEDVRRVEDPSKEPRVTASSCSASHDCSWNQESQICTMSTENPTYFLEFGGDYCGCDTQTGLCRHTRVEPVPCNTTDDCGYSRDPFLHPKTPPWPVFLLVELPAIHRLHDGGNTE
jgi:hypothetical protein